MVRNGALRDKRHGTVPYGAVVHGMIRYDTVWYCMVPGTRNRVWYGMIWYGIIWHGMVWYGTVWYGMVWYGMVRYGMIWYDMV